jgi:hypothetical protein
MGKRRDNIELNCGGGIILAIAVLADDAYNTNGAMEEHHQQLTYVTSWVS